MKDFHKSNMTMVFLTTLSSGINYLCQIAMGHAMSFASYGVMNSLFSLILILNVPGSSINMLTAKKVAQCRDDESACAEVSGRMAGLSGRIAIGGMVLITILCVPMANVLEASPLMLPLTGAAVAASMLPFIISGVLTGKGRFLAAGLFSLIVPVIKSAGVAVSMLVGDELAKQIVVMCAVIVGNLFATLIFKKVLFPNGLPMLPTPKGCRVMDRSTLFVMAANLFFLMFGNGDVILVTMFFGSEQSGIYSASMLFGRVIFFFTTALVSVLLPYVSQISGSGKSAERVFLSSLAMLLGVSVVCIVPICFFPDFFITLLYGSRYLEAVRLMPYSCAAAVAASLVNLELSYLVGIGKERRMAAHLAAALAVLAAGSALCHSSVEQLLIWLVAVLLAVFLIEFPVCIKSKHGDTEEMEGKQ